MTQIHWLLLPLFIHMGLLIYVGVRTVKGRVNAVMSRTTRLKEIALNSSNWPEDVRKFGNNFSNQFEVPTLWYALCGLLVATAKVDSVEVTLSWLFVAARLVHIIIHTGSNNVRYRMFAFLTSFAALTAMWAWFGLRLYFLG